jgi:ribosomal protein S18 acetylase RimI-like enzyme
MSLAQEGYGLLPVVEVSLEALAGFDCGKQHLNEFLRNASDFHRDRLGLTSVVFHGDMAGRVIGYFTLANDSLPLTTSEQGELGLQNIVALRAYPAVKLGRLAIASDFQDQGVGEQVMDLVHGEILDSASLSAARLVIVDADNDPRVVKFYRKLGYQESLWAEKQGRKESGSKSVVPASTIKMIRDILS